ncbi:CU044_5270 family protein (plasmid) [Streptomyces sp. NBC_00012]|uniref:CU044_5270 family protein n=1 Tax=Streptomyces sp. NBC_00012 TaxID=2975621 RepID=UPI002F90733C
MKHDDLMRRLADARPGRLDPGRPVDPELRRTELQGVMARTGEPQVAPGKRGRSRLGVRPAWNVALAGAAAVAAAVLVVTTAGPPGLGPRPEAGAPATAFSESRILLAAAFDVEKTEATSGAYWYQEERIGVLRRIPGKDYTLDVRQESKTWLTKGTGKRDRRWTLHIDAGARPATPADEKAWRADGSPKRWDLTDYDQARRDTQRERNKHGRKDDMSPEPQPEIVTWDGEGEVAGDAPGGGADTVSAGAEIGLAELESLPTDPERLRERLEQIVDEQYNAPQHILQELLGQTAENLAVELPVSPQLRAAAYRVRALLPGVRDIGEVTDRSGRPGYAVEIRSLRPGVEYKRRLIFDKETGLPLSEELYATSARDGHRSGELADYTILTAMRWTDQAPPFDKDFMADEPESPSVETDVKPADKR